MEEKLFDIPIYICPIDEYNSYWYKHYESACRRTEDSDEEWAEKFDILKQNNYRKTTWMYQAIIGYIGVYKQEIDLFATLSIEMEKKARLKNRYIDIEPFYNFCKYVDWHKVFYPEED